MKKTVLLLSLITVASALSATAATIKIGSTPNRADGNIMTVPGAGGGEFAANGSEFSGAYSPLAKYGDSFATFCLERNETINLGGTYQYFLNPEGSVNGGFAGGNPDPISQGTAWLYRNFALGTLADYDYLGSDRKADAGYLQDAFWFLEQEFADDSIPLNRAPANPFLAAVAAEFGSYDNARLDNALYPVYALNLTKTDRSGKVIMKQDVLVFRPVPEGGTTSVLLGTGLLGLMAIRRRLA